MASFTSRVCIGQAAVTTAGWAGQIYGMCILQRFTGRSADWGTQKHYSMGSTTASVKASKAQVLSKEYWLFAGLWHLNTCLGLVSDPPTSQAKCWHLFWPVISSDPKARISHLATRLHCCSTENHTLSAGCSVVGFCFCFFLKLPLKGIPEWFNNGKVACVFFKGK